MVETKNVGVVSIPREHLFDNPNLEWNLVLPDGVKVFGRYEDYATLTTNIIVVSNEPVEGVTFPTPPGCLISAADFSIEDGKVIVGKRRE